MTKIKIFGSILIVMLITSCGSDPKQTKETELDPEEKTTLSPDEQLYTDASAKLVSYYMNDLKSELMMAVKNGDFASAINVCNIKAPEITTNSSQKGWSIRRVSDRSRNHNNRADSSELFFLENFADSSEFSPNFLIEWVGPDTARLFRYYKPIRTGRFCLNCHGDFQTLATDVYKTVKTKYPWDKATGYKEGDLRGMFIVEAEWPGGKEYAEELIAGRKLSHKSAAMQPADNLGDPVLIDSGQ